MTDTEQTQTDAETAAMTMRAVVQDTYGAPDQVMSLAVVPVPVPEDDQVLIRVHASSVNAMEWHLSTGRPLLVHLSMGFRRPKIRTLGADVAGVVAAIGPEVKTLQVGDEVIGEIHKGAYAEYAVASEKLLIPKPAGVTDEQGASLGVAALTALQGLRDHGELKAGEHVMIIGASGGVGSFAVPMAKALGAKVTAVCSTDNVETARANGADHVIDYTTDDYTQASAGYDIIFDGPSVHRPAIYKKLLVSGGRYVMFGGPKRKIVGPIPKMIALKVSFLRGDKSMGWFLAQMNRDDLAQAAAWVASGSVKPVIQSVRPLDDVPAVLAELGRGHSRGKAVIKVR